MASGGSHRLVQAVLWFAETEGETVDEVMKGVLPLRHSGISLFHASDGDWSVAVWPDRVIPGLEDWVLMTEARRRREPCDHFTIAVGEGRAIWEAWEMWVKKWVSDPRLHPWGRYIECTRSWASQTASGEVGFPAMKQGAVAVFDALGFKGIWNREDPDKVIAKLNALRDEVSEELADLHNRTNALEKHLGIETQLTVALLSDTVVIGAYGQIVDHNDGREQDDCDWLAVLALARVTGKVLVRAARTAPALAYRGCISVGRFNMTGNFIIGPAIDEAVESMNNANAAVVWLTPTALRTWAKQFDPKDGVINAVVSPYAVPMKGGDRYQTFVANDCASIEDPQERSKHIDRVLATFASSRLDVQIKRQNTARFYLEMNASLASRPLGPEEPTAG
ncbi:MAG: hypothetical protein WDO69_33885 [Pseudomonadota bacterium]